MILRGVKISDQLDSRMQLLKRYLSDWPVMCERVSVETVVPLHRATPPFLGRCKPYGRITGIP